MKLYDYIKTFKKAERVGIRKKIAAAHKVSEITVRAWANGTRNHPYTLKAVKITEASTAGKVTRYDLRPDVYQRPGRRGTG